MLNKDKSPHIEINKEFKLCLSLIDAGRNLLITGKAGTGKSTLLRYYRNLNGDSIPVIAPTGIAALNVEGMTIHKFFAFKKNITKQEIVDGKYKPRKKQVETFKALRVLVIDEISMVRADLFDCIDCVLRKHGPSGAKPFGGIQLILFGDLFQLDPVVAREEESYWTSLDYKTKYFFSSNAILPLDLKIVELQKIYRQKDSKFISLLNSVRSDQLTKEELEELNQRVDSEFEPPLDSPYVILTTNNKHVRDINSDKLRRLSGKKHTCKADVEGSVDENDWGNIDKTLHFKIGAKVIMTNNDFTHAWVNGSVGIIMEFVDAESPLVKIKLVETGDVVEVARHRFEITKYERQGGKFKTVVVGAITQFPFKLSWAITVHRSQGQTLSHVIVDPHGGFFAEGQLYVALSRCTEFEGLSLTKKLKAKDLKVNRSVHRFLASQKCEVDLASRAFAFLGVKTTKFGMRFRDTDKIIEIAVVIVYPTGEVRKYSSLVQPNTDVGATAKHGISASDLSLAPPLDDVWPFFARRLHGTTLVSSDLDKTLSELQAHLKSLNILHSMNDGLSLREEIEIDFEKACKSLDISLSGRSTALEIATATQNVFDENINKKSVRSDVGLFDGAPAFSRTSRIFSRDYFSSSMADVKKQFCSELIEGVSKEISYADAISWLCGVVDFSDKSKSINAADLCSMQEISRDVRHAIHSQYVEDVERAARIDEELSENELNYLNQICTLLRVSKDIEVSVDNESTFAAAKGMGIYFSGEFLSPFSGEKIKKAVLFAAAEKWGFKPLKSVTKTKCEVLVVCSKSSMSDNTKKARKWGIPILDLNEFCKTIDVSIECLH